jgi:8-oxo-dGTP pyrophosphatase MutT (NUDIX family)
MQHRIRAAALIVQDNRILLVKHKHPITGNVWWVPPGGGLKDAESIFECAKRETWEETGLRVDLTRVVSFRQFADMEHGAHCLELFLLAASWSGSLTLANLTGEPDEQYVDGLEFLSREELQSITVYPEILKNHFWEDFKKGFPETKYLGVQRP